MCPESGNTSPMHGKFSAISADIWALGVTLFCFTFKTVPFDGENVLDILTNIEQKKSYSLSTMTNVFFRLEFPSVRPISKELELLLTKMMEKDPDKRITLK